MNKEDLEMSDSVIAGFAEALLNEHTRIGAILVLEGFRERAIKCVPLIIGVMNTNDPLTKMYCANALKSITGKDFGEDPEAWKKWWSSHEQK